MCSTDLLTDSILLIFSCFLLSSFLTFPLASPSSFPSTLSFSLFHYLSISFFTICFSLALSLSFLFISLFHTLSLFISLSIHLLLSPVISHLALSICLYLASILIIIFLKVGPIGALFSIMNRTYNTIYIFK